MRQPVKTFKFGGASVKDAAAVKNVAGILANCRHERLIIVISAMGKTTNALEEVINAHVQQTGEAKQKYEAIKHSHYALAKELLGDDDEEVFNDLNDIFVEGEWVLDEAPHSNYDYCYDQVIGIGELISTTIVAAYLKSQGLPTQWLDSRDILKTDEIFREATVLWPQTIENAEKIMMPILQGGGWVVTQGFIGSTADNATASLGREGSDYSAAIFSYCLDAESMTIWKDVPGVLTADPRLFDNVTQLYRLSYQEAIEMTYYGARVIHPKTIKPLQNKTIPLHVKSFINPDAKGTVISADVDDIYPPIIVVENNQALLNISTKDFSFVAEHHLGNIFTLFAKHRIWVNLMKNTAINFIVCLPNDKTRVAGLLEDLQKEFNYVIEEGLELVTVRHYQTDVLAEMKQGKLVLLEDNFDKTVQMVLRDVPMIRRRSAS